MKKATNQKVIYGTKTLNCDRCHKLVLVDINTAKVTCGNCNIIIDIENDPKLKAELDFEEKLTKAQWQTIIDKKKADVEARIEERRNVDLDEVVAKRNKKKQKEKKFIETSVKKQKEKKKLKKGV